MNVFPMRHPSPSMDKVAHVLQAAHDAGEDPPSFAELQRLCGMGKNQVAGVLARLRGAGFPHCPEKKFVILRGVPNKAKIATAARKEQRRLLAAGVPQLPKAPPPKAPRHSKGCQYIAGEPTADDACKCGLSRQAESSWCPEHHALCHEKAKPMPPEFHRTWKKRAA